MRKTILGLGVFVLGFSSWWQPSGVFAAKAPAPVRVQVPAYPIIVNGTALDIRHSEYPPLVYKNIAYFPMTHHNAAALGLAAEFDGKRGLSLQKQETCAPTAQNLTVQARPANASYTAAVTPFPVAIGGKPAENAGAAYPVLLFNNIVYFPMTWAFTHDAFGWRTSWDAARGLAIDACADGTNAQAEQAAALNAGNGGRLAVQGEWLFMNRSVKRDGPAELIKVKQDGTGEIKLSDDNAWGLQVSGDWLYYIAVAGSGDNGGNRLYRMKTDGSERTKLAEVSASQLRVHGDWLYYVRMDLAPGGERYTQSGIHRMKLDGSGDQALEGGRQGYGLFLQGDSLYFLLREEKTNQGSLYRMGLDGSGQQKLKDQVSAAYWIDGWIYYITEDGKQLHKMSPDQAVSIPLYTSERSITSLQYRQGWLYLLSGTFGAQGTAYIDKLYMDGTGFRAVGQARATSLYMAGRSLYYPQTAAIGETTLEKVEIE